MTLTIHIWYDLRMERTLHFLNELQFMCKILCCLTLVCSSHLSQLHILFRVIILLHIPLNYNTQKKYNKLPC